MRHIVGCGNGDALADKILCPVMPRAANCRSEYQSACPQQQNLTDFLL
jgi:hypothetical protein